MFRRTRLLLNQNILKDIEEVAPQLKDKPKKLLDYYTPNDKVLQENIPYELRGQYLPRRKINPFRKTPMNVIYDQHSFMRFVLPSRHEHVFGPWGYENLFGVKRWANHSPYMSEYIRIDNQIFLFVFLLLILLWPLFIHKHLILREYQDNTITADYGKFTADDLL
jgi:hypothetical protein